MFVLGTAGHIDHGKSLLVKAMTGIDPDRLREEKERGMTIELGFAWVKLPSGREVGIVDVPGHERFVKNMLAGVGGIDLALLIVAANEGVMPHTREHLAILHLLGVDRAILVITKKDRVDEEMLTLVRMEAEEVVVAAVVDVVVGVAEVVVDVAPAAVAAPRRPMDSVATVATSMRVTRNAPAASGCAAMRSGGGGAGARAPPVGSGAAPRGRGRSGAGGARRWRRAPRGRRPRPPGPSGGPRWPRPARAVRLPSG